MTPSYILKIRFNIILPFAPDSSKWSLSLRFSHQNTVHTSSRLLTCYMSRLFHSSWMFSCSRLHVHISYIRTFVIFFPHGATAHSGPGPHCQGFMITETNTLGRNPLDEWSARRRDFYQTTHNTHNRKISMLSGGIRTHNPLDGVATDIGCRLCVCLYRV